MPYFGASTDLGALVDIGGFMDEVCRLRLCAFRAEVFQNNSTVMQRALTGIQHPQHSEALFAIANRRGSGFHAIEKVLAFGLQRLAIFELNDFAVSLHRSRHPVAPFDLVGI